MSAVKPDNLKRWKARFKHDPTQPLEKCEDRVIRYSYETDIEGASCIELGEVWDDKRALAILKKQRNDGSWRYPSKSGSVWKLVDNDQYETFRKLAQLVEKYKFNKEHPSLPRIADYFFAHQSTQGDIRGIYANQTSPNYTAAVLELLIKAGYENDPRLRKSMDWLLSCRQSDGGWALALRTRGFNLDAFDLKETIAPDLTKPSAHAITGAVLRTLAIHPQYRARKATQGAAELLVERIFTSDKYPDRRHQDFWTRFAFPFVYTDIVSALDSLSLLGFSTDHPKIQEALYWFEAHQAADGMITTIRNPSGKGDMQLWLQLAICRVYQRFCVKRSLAK